MAREKARVVRQGQKPLSNGIVQSRPGGISASHGTGEYGITGKNCVMDFIRNSARGMARCEKNFNI